MRWVLILGISAAPALADEAFDLCMADAMGQFERSLTRNPGPGAPDVALLTMDDVLRCGGAGIQRCDLTEDRVTCQGALTEVNDLLTAHVLDSLPAPETLEAPESRWRDGLYPVMWELAHGSSAGADCAGQFELRTAWCEAVEANRRLGTAVMTWQLARLFEAVPSAVEAGWADVPPPPQPSQRPAR